jgi:hypothetical protein
VPTLYVSCILSDPRDMLLKVAEAFPGSAFVMAHISQAVMLSGSLASIALGGALGVCAVLKRAKASPHEPTQLAQSDIEHP